VEGRHAPDPLALAHVTLTDFASRLQSDPAHADLCRSLESLVAQVAQLRRSRGVHAAERRIGVFGASKRGKSSVLNTLLGVPLLPVMKTPMTAIEIEVRHDAVASPDRYRLLDSAGGMPEQGDLAHASGFLRLVASRVGKQETEADDQTPRGRERVSVSSFFAKSAVFNKRIAGTLVDTPGADGTLGTNDRKLLAEGQRALAAMRELHAVLFCIRLDMLQCADDAKPFATHCAALRPIVVASYADQWSEARDPAACVADWLRIPASRVVCIDARTGRGGGERQGAAIESLVGLIAAELASAGRATEDATRVLHGLDYLLTGEALERMRKIRWPRTTWEALRSSLNEDGRAVMQRTFERFQRRLAR